MLRTPSVSQTFLKNRRCIAALITTEIRVEIVINLESNFILCIKFRVVRGLQQISSWAKFADPCIRTWFSIHWAWSLSSALILPIRGLFCWKLEGPSFWYKVWSIGGRPTAMYVLEFVISPIYNIYIYKLAAMLVKLNYCKLGLTL